jgi:hypothetical protein
MMETVDIFPLTEQTIAQLLTQRGGDAPEVVADCQRRAPRWPFPGTVELWLPDETGRERYELATSMNLSHHGIGIRFEEPLRPGHVLNIAIHEPEASFHGRAEVRHCTELSDGTFYIGMQFRFDAT